MNNLQIFNNPEFGDIRTLTINGEPWFVGRDIASALGYAKPENAIRDRVREKDTLKQGIPTNGGIQQTLLINEGGLYRLVFGSKLQSAERFQDWVYDEVLPSIRKTGSYALPQTPDEKIQLIAQGYVEIRKDVDEVKSELQELKDDLPIFLNEAQIVTDTVKKKGVEMMGGKESEAYASKSLRSTVYFDIYNELYRNFGITTYKALKRNQLNKALEVIKGYTLPIIIKDKIDLANAQAKLAL